MTPSLARSSHPRSVFKRRRNRRRRIIWIPVSRNIVSYSPLLCQWVASSVWRRRLCLNLQPGASRRNGSNPTCGRADMSIVGWPSQWSVTPTAASRYPGCWSTRSTWGYIQPLLLNNAQEKNFKKKVYLMHSKTQEQKNCRPKVLFLRTHFWDTFHQNCDQFN